MPKKEILKTILFALGLLALGSVVSRAESVQDGGMPPPTVHGVNSAPVVIQDPRQNPEVMEPQDPAVNCSATPNSAKCLSQVDSFKRAGEAASFLSYYQRNYSNFGQVMNDMQKDPEKLKEYNESLQGCISGTKCDKKDQARLLRALVQYNFGKELKANMLENKSRELRMGSMYQPVNGDESKLEQTKVLVARFDKKDRRERDFYRTPGSTSSLKNTFKLHPRDVHAIDWDKISQAERDQFGVAFNQNFNGFVDMYTSTEGKSRWHYVPAVTSAVGGGKQYIPAVDPKNRDPRQGLAQINHERYDLDRRIQGSQNVKEIVEVFKKEYSNVNKKRKMSTEQNIDDKSKDYALDDSMKAATENMGFGLPQSELARIGKGGENPNTPTDVAAAVVIKINDDIYKAEMKQKMQDPPADSRMPSSSESRPAGTVSTNRRVSATVDVAEFDKFLDDIWPPGVAKK